MATNRSEKRSAKRAERRASRSEKKAARGQRSAKTRRAIGDFIVQKRSIVPNMITMSNMTMGFFAIILASRGDARSLAVAGIMVFLGTLFDAVDGAVARAMHVASPVGVQLDSLADGIAYGIAPAVIAYQAYLSKLPSGAAMIDFGMFIALIYPICAIYRLARFNIGAEEDDHTRFCGLPSPAAGILIALVPVLEIPDFLSVLKLTVSFPWQVFIAIYVVISLLMVSRVDYSKVFPDIYRIGGKPFLVLAIILAILGIGLFSAWAIFWFMSLYTVIGMVFYAIKLIRRRKTKTTAKGDACQ
ncbi:MAG TPA: CDP-diacylglycerol--serine O-phosphatidyltransferase [Spirochaetota bacterium]|nr:CDP-diacylglycerol--serine O-phosphatidyltransferase [Spirochaetota bacterium]HPC41054.1 CDP-diacylglycerol--serine O-phosphatidyltransferase [Spirochaetota bacterium]HQF08833.1 CDP-diacylglycerol--serine O-phosphatidyltransferase [Spirochaetota bacterium]HQH97452.1 CDP-diacylglycerol--serine O-phosphatidyltransferase [Spirochaetota bacterium]HQJ70963.1 CDP-diacylglycerol--serine O-phosphatidyltransferase [Spirochaetota bacterium]